MCLYFNHSFYSLYYRYLKKNIPKTQKKLLPKKRHSAKKLAEQNNVRKKNVSQLTQLPVLRVIYVLIAKLKTVLSPMPGHSGTMWRGMENIVKGADPRDAWMIMQRICGVCTTVHAIISVRAVEDAIGAKVPVNAQYIRNMILAAHSIHDHIVHFYQLSAMDWVDITAALQADPEKAADMLKGVSTWSLNSANEFRNVQKKIQALVDSGQLGIFANGISVMLQ